MEQLEELRQSYYRAIIQLRDEEDILKALPQPSHYNYFEIMNGLIQKLSDDIALNQRYVMEETDLEMQEMYKDEILFSFFKKEICEKALKENLKEYDDNQKFVKNVDKHIIFSIRSNGETYFLNDLKSLVPEEYYSTVIKCIGILENGSVENNVEKGRCLRCDETVKGIHEIKDFKYRLYYRILDDDLAFVFLTKIKKSDNDKKDKEIIRVRSKNTIVEYEYLKELIKDDSKKEALIKQHEELKEQILDYLYKNQRGVKVSEK